MINSSEYLAKDVYDVVVAHVKDRASLEHAFGLLEQDELEALAYDAQSGAIEVHDLNRVIDPMYSGNRIID